MYHHPWPQGVLGNDGSFHVALTEASDSMSFYREFRQKVNITFNDNDTVSYMESRSLHFQPDKSKGSESDYIVLPNILVLVRLWPYVNLMPTLLPPPPPLASKVNPSPTVSMVTTPSSLPYLPSECLGPPPWSLGKHEGQPHWGPVGRWESGRAGIY